MYSVSVLQMKCFIVGDLQGAVMVAADGQNGANNLVLLPVTPSAASPLVQPAQLLPSSGLAPLGLAQSPLLQPQLAPSPLGLVSSQLVQPQLGHLSQAQLGLVQSSILQPSQLGQIASQMGHLSQSQIVQSPQLGQLLQPQVGQFQSPLRQIVQSPQMGQMASPLLGQVPTSPQLGLVRSPQMGHLIQPAQLGLATSQLTGVKNTTVSTQIITSLKQVTQVCHPVPSNQTNSSCDSVESNSQDNQKLTSNPGTNQNESQMEMTLSDVAEQCESIEHLLPAEAERIPQSETVQVSVSVPASLTPSVMLKTSQTTTAIIPEAEPKSDNQTEPGAASVPLEVPSDSTESPEAAESMDSQTCENVLESDTLTSSDMYEHDTVTEASVPEPHDSVTLTKSSVPESHDSVTLTDPSGPAHTVVLGVPQCPCGMDAVACRCSPPVSPG